MYKKNLEVPNQRSKDQTLIAFALDAELMRGLDAAREKKGQNRSAFIRDAIMAAVRERGIAVSPSAARSPDRARVQRYPETTRAQLELNEKPTSSGAPSTLKGAVARAVAKAKKDGVAYGRLQKAGSTSGKTS